MGNALSSISPKRRHPVNEESFNYEILNHPRMEKKSTNFLMNGLRKLSLSSGKRTDSFVRFTNKVVELPPKIYDVAHSDSDQPPESKTENKVYTIRLEVRKKAESSFHPRPEQVSFKQLQRSDPVGITATPQQVPAKKNILQASTSELLRCIGNFVVLRCRRLKTLEPMECVFWLRSVDKGLILQGWQDMAFINPANMVFLYMLIKETIDPNIGSYHELKAHMLSCLYLSYSYCGQEISYPLKPFIIEIDRERFWNRVMAIVHQMSAKMLRLNSDPAYFTQLFAELKAYSL